MTPRTLLGLLSLLLLLPEPARALVIAGDSSAYGEYVGLSGIVAAASGPLPTAQGVAPAPFVDTNTILSVSVAGTLLTSDTLTVNASSDVDGAAGARQAAADASVENLGINVGILLATLVTLDADAVTSDAQVVGDYGGFGSAGSTSIVNGVLTVDSLAAIALAANPAPNTVIFNLLGVKVTLNEQIAAGNGVDALSLLVNAIHVEFTNAVLGLGLVNGDIIISQSEAALGGTAQVPEPASVLLLGLGTLGLAVAGRRHRG